MFDVLGSLGVVDGADVLDAFAGSGALGIEALSRGARSVTFVDSSRDAVRSVEDNLERVGFSGRREVRVVRMDVLAFLASSVASYDVALLDPPYRFDAWEDVLATIDARVVVAESRAPVDVPDRFELHRVYRYGGTLVTVASESGRPASARGGRTAPEGSS